MEDGPSPSKKLIRMSSTISTRFMIISDTHSYDFDARANARVPFQHPLPKCDVLLHCGDLTMNGELVKLDGLVRMLGSIDAELKLVIAGNHDRTLDGPHWRKYCGGDIPHDEEWFPEDSDDDDLQDHVKAMEIMTGPSAKAAGITYLEEGIHTFTLQNGANFTVYASPYQPEFCGYAFAYERDEDRFNPPEHVLEGVKKISGSVTVPDFPAVDIMMTHGPPKGILDEVGGGGRMRANVGCDALLTAVSRARPLLYCFGHIHEGYGAKLVTWKRKEEEDKDKSGFGLGADAIEMMRDMRSVFPDVLGFEPEVEFGRETLMVNAAVRNVHYFPSNAPWVIDLKLPLSKT